MLKPGEKKSKQINRQKQRKNYNVKLRKYYLAQTCNSGDGHNTWVTQSFPDLLLVSFGCLLLHLHRAWSNCRESISQGQLGSFCIAGTLISFFRELKSPTCSECECTAWAVNSETCTWNTTLHLFWQLCFHTWLVEMFCYIRGHEEYIFLLQKWYIFGGKYLNHQLLHCPSGILL